MRLIDADNLRKRHCGCCAGINNKTCSFRDNVCDTMDWVDEEPTIDPVKHGHWINENKNGMSFVFICSECKKLQFKSDYCPNCGAKMDLPLEIKASDNDEVSE